MEHRAGGHPGRQEVRSEEYWEKSWLDMGKGVSEQGHLEISRWGRWDWNDPDPWTQMLWFVGASSLGRGLHPLTYRCLFSGKPWDGHIINAGIQTWWSRPSPITKLPTPLSGLPCKFTDWTLSFFCCPLNLFCPLLFCFTKTKTYLINVTHPP